MIACMTELFRLRASHWHARAGRGVVGLWALAMLVGCQQIVPPPPSGVTDVATQGIAFVPKEVTIHVGESVRWTNRETLPISHTTTSGDSTDANPGSLWDSGTLAPGQSFTRMFDTAGEFEYYCRFHPTVDAMRHAKVIVEP